MPDKIGLRSRRRHQPPSSLPRHLHSARIPRTMAPTNSYSVRQVLRTCLAAGNTTRQRLGHPSDWRARPILRHRCPGRSAPFLRAAQGRVNGSTKRLSCSRMSARPTPANSQTPYTRQRCSQALACAFPTPRSPALHLRIARQMPAQNRMPGGMSAFFSNRPPRHPWRGTGPRSRRR